MLRTEFAPAKINLTLEILGRRPDGYHEIRSLVVFAQDVGDRLTLGAGSSAGTQVTGPFARSLAGVNLADKAVAAVVAAATGIEPEHLTLEKNLPVASGIGGGSADAAAVLRLMQRANPAAASIDALAIARTLGADVPVCMRSRAAMMTGTGEHIEPVSLPNALFAVLANPLVRVPQDKTSQVFALLAAAPRAHTLNEALPVFGSVRDVTAYAAARGNGLAGPACKLIPAIDAVLVALRRLPGCRLAQLSGAGPTCFALFQSEDAAGEAASELQRQQPDWWIRPTRLL